MHKKKFSFIVALLAALSFIPSKVMAHCPLCTAAVGTGLLVTRSFGVDDSLVGIWVGAFIISTALWLNKVLVKRFGEKVPFQKGLIIVASFLLTVVPFYFSNIINFQGTIFMIDRLLFGTIAGSALTLLGFRLNKIVRNVNNKPVIPFQSIVLTVAILVLSDLALTLVI